MIDSNAVYAVLALIAIYATMFFLFPNRVAQYWERDDLPVHQIMRHFRYREARRVWISIAGIAGSVIVAVLVPASIVFPVALFLGLVALAGADAFQIRRLSRDIPRWSPGARTDDGGALNRGPVLDLVFGKKPGREK